MEKNKDDAETFRTIKDRDRFEELFEDHPDDPVAFGDDPSKAGAATLHCLPHILRVTRSELSDAEDRHDANGRTIQELLQRLSRPERPITLTPHMLAGLSRLIARDSVHLVQRERGRREYFEAVAADAVASPSCDDPVEVASRRDMVRHLNAALARLAESERETLRLRYIEGLPTNDLARRLQVTPRTVNIRIHRALSRVRHYLLQGTPTPSPTSETENR